MFREFAPLGPNFQRIGYIDFERKEVTPLEEQDNISCDVPFYSYMINVHGEVAPCCALATNDNLVSFGNIKEHTFEDIWNSTAYNDFRIMLLRDRWQEPKCRNCSAVPKPPYGKFLQDTNMEEKPYWHKEVQPTRYYPKNNIVSREEMTQLLNAGETVEASYLEVAPVVWTGFLNP